MSGSKRKFLYYRQKLLLALLQAFGGRLPNTDLQKYLFLFTEKHQKNKSYEFVPYKYGCFSFQSYADKKKLIDIGTIKENVKYWELADETDHLSRIATEDRKNLLPFREEYKNIKGKNLVREVYRLYPYYAVNSEISTELMNENELERINRAKPSQTDYGFFTIGYEGKSFENYLNRLIKNNVRVLCDVRKNAVSRKYGFSGKTLSETLEKIGIGYVHMSELGIVSEKRKALSSQADYDILFNEYEVSVLTENKGALEKLLGIFLKHRRVAITCFEADHIMCHRNRVAKALSQHPAWKYKIVHI